jgi:hypothetical protein
MRRHAGTLALLPIVALLLTGCVGSASPAESDAPTSPSESSSTAPAATSTGTPPAPSAAAPATSLTAPVALPTSCDQIYSPDYLQSLQAAAGILVLNPAWTDVEGAASLGTKNAALLPALQTKGRLDCFWAKPSGGGGVGLTTSVSLISSDEQAALVTTTTSEGYTCEAEERGTRCSTSHQDATASGGETQFFGGGLWIATFWVEFGPDGYTDDVVATLLS